MDLKLKQIPRPIYLRYILLNIPGLAAVILILIIIQYWVVLPVMKRLLPVCWRRYRNRL